MHFLFMVENGISIKEKRIRKIVDLYYSRSDVQEAMFNFARYREISPRYFEGFGKRPDTLEYPGDVMAFVKNSATSFHCSEELWKDPLRIVTGMTEKQANELRSGWDLLIDIDCKWFDYSKLAAKAVIQALKNNGVKNVGLKFSGSKGWHIIVPWKAFPEEVAGEKMKDLFPDLPRKLVGYLGAEAEKIMSQNLPDDFYDQFKNVEIKKGIKCNKCSAIVKEFILKDFFCRKCNLGEQRKVEINNSTDFKCPGCKNKFDVNKSKAFYECENCGINSDKNMNNFSQSIQTDLFELMGLDLILVSPRHLFRMPYSLHEKTALASIVISPEEIDDFQLKDANFMKVKIKNFMPESESGEAKEFVVRALDWYSLNKPKEIIKETTGKYDKYKPIELGIIKNSQFPPCVQNILKGVKDGKKRAVFVLINLFRSIGMSKEDLEKKIYEWNEKNEVPLKKGYITSQLSWSYRRKPILPQNCKEFYQGIGVCAPDSFCSRIKNPVNYVVGKNYAENKSNKSISDRINEKNNIGKKKINQIPKKRFPKLSSLNISSQPIQTYRENKDWVKPKKKVLRDISKKISTKDKVVKKKKDDKKTGNKK